MNRPPRRTLRRHRRCLPLALQLQRLSDAVQTSAPTRREGVDLAELLPRVWRQARDQVWTVAWLRDHGLIAPADARCVGQALSALATVGGRLGGFELRRIAGADREGRLWQLVSRW